ncbi:flagellar hook-length control protein FliK [Rheinheimera sp. 4Y26]|uniref:flagellar hook-length control protein FliK n=1 Tax=Rheinheimera sp. 4Y26 TaxID=2977811 RepID=UPI0021B0E16F|nr:flagellar hook-length control protein FliK [Rheinheimera sp. 4Y26]MCT6699853.1 flagellar hook-length control protein FliK [Rheinheimera sp. 4Y26]
MLPLTNTTKSPATGSLLSASPVLPGQIDATAQEQSSEDQTAALLDLSMLLEQPYPEDAQQEAVASLLSQEAEMPLTDLTQAAEPEMGVVTNQAQQLLQAQQSAILAAGYSQSQSLLPHTFVHQTALAAMPQLTSSAESGQDGTVSMPLPTALYQNSVAMPAVSGMNGMQSGPISPFSTLLNPQITLQSGSPLTVPLATQLAAQTAAETITVPAVAGALQALAPAQAPGALVQSLSRPPLTSETSAAAGIVASQSNTAAALQLLSAESGKVALAGEAGNISSRSLFTTSQPATFSASTLLTTDNAAAAVLQSAGGNAALSSQHQWQSEPMPADPARFGQRLVALLTDKVDIQLGLGVNRAMIRLDPPTLGSIDLSIQFEGEKLTVQLNSSNGQLKEAMQQGLDQLRTNLQLKLGADTLIELRMGPDNQSRQQHERHAPPADEIAANIAGAEQTENQDSVVAVTTGLVNQLV